MNRFVVPLGRVLVTTAMVALASIVSWHLWTYTMRAPWTRDGRVRADIVGLAPDVSGLVTQVFVRDNEAVRRGEVIFQIDPARFALALRQAQAVVDTRRAALVEAVREANRFEALTNLSVSQERKDQRESTLQQTTAAYQEAVADRDTAQLNLDRTKVVASVNGTITNFDLQPGNYVTAGHPVTALVDSDSLRVEGYFEETKLARIHVGDPVSISLMGESRLVHGHVESLAGGIEDRERDGSGLLANINPTFSWVRLAQRIPVRVRIDTLPPGLRLLPGRTATVWIEDGSAKSPGGLGGAASLHPALFSFLLWQRPSTL
jgi:multidrug resistance efflux pump